MLVAAPLATRPVVKVVAWPFVATVGVIGKLARQNALRVPRRTAATASALMIGLALVAAISVLASSVKASITEGVTNELTADFVLNGGSSPVPTIRRHRSSLGPRRAVGRVPEHGRCPHGHVLDHRHRDHAGRTVRQLRRRHVRRHRRRPATKRRPRRPHHRAGPALAGR